MNFVIVYTVEAHPEDEAGPYGKGGKGSSRQNAQSGHSAGQPKSAEERAARAASCVQRLGLRTPIVIDTMDDATWKAYGSAPNCACLIGRDGKVIEQQGWFEPHEMRKAIEALIGKTN